MKLYILVSNKNKVDIIQRKNLKRHSKIDSYTNQKISNWWLTSLKENHFIMNFIRNRMITLVIESFYVLDLITIKWQS